jgi:hypothetical protein
MANIGKDKPDLLPSSTHRLTGITTALRISLHELTSRPTPGCLHGDGGRQRMAAR